MLKIQTSQGAGGKAFDCLMKKLNNFSLTFLTKARSKHGVFSCFSLFI
jgi:hypothetical protein